MLSSIRAHAGRSEMIQPVSSKAGCEGTRWMGSSETLLSGKASCQLKVESFAEEEGFELAGRLREDPPIFLTSDKQDYNEATSALLKGNLRNLLFCPWKPFSNRMIKLPNSQGI